MPALARYSRPVVLGFKIAVSPAGSLRENSASGALESAFDVIFVADGDDQRLVRSPLEPLSWKS
jgi:hypothetical protein